MNLWRADNLSIKDKMADPIVPFIQRFHWSTLYISVEAVTINV